MKMLTISSCKLNTLTKNLQIKIIISVSLLLKQHPEMIECKIQNKSINSNLSKIHILDRLNKDVQNRISTLQA